MEKTFNPSNNMWSLDTDAGHILHKIGSSNYPELRHLTVKADHVDAWEEIAVADIPPYTKAEYKSMIVELIRRRYDADDEAAIVANALVDNPSEEHRAEFAAYQSYRRECKAAAVSALTERTSNNRSGT